MARRPPPPRRRPQAPEPISGAVEAVSRRLAAGSGTARLGVAWAAAAGPGVARRTRLLGVEGGTLHLAVADPDWARELSALAPALVKRLGEVLGRSTIHAIRVQVRADARPEPAPAPDPPRAVAVPDEALLAEVRAFGVTDPALGRAIAGALGAARRRGRLTTPGERD